MSMRSTTDVLARNLQVAGSWPALPGPVAPPSPPTGVLNEFSENAGAWNGYALTLESQVQQPLNLSLPLKSPGQFPALAQVLVQNAEAFHQGVLGLRYVHFARFLPSADYSQLLVITAFDGDFESYLMDFIGVMAGLFNDVMVFIKDAPPLPVERYPNEFAAYVKAHHNAQAAVLSAYPHLSALEIQHLSGIRGNDLRHGPPPRPVLAKPPMMGVAPAPAAAPPRPAWPAPTGPSRVPDPPVLDLDDIQGNILRGYRRLPDVCHLAVQVGSPAGGRTVLKALVDGTADIPAVETASEWADRPSACLNVSFTADGLTALGVPADVLATFPEAFRQGSAYRSRSLATDPTSPFYRLGIGDVGASDPANWTLGGLDGEPVHLLVSVATNESVAPRREAIVAAITALLASSGGRVVDRRDGNGFAHGQVHFGYRDGIAQPRIQGAPGPRRPDRQPDAPAGDFLLGRGYVNTYRGNYLGGIPPQLGDNATYLAFRVLAQDVAGFERFIQRTGERFDMDPELVAAKLCGRWRTSGVPLVVSPVDGAVHLEDDQLDDFDFASTLAHPTDFDDADGVRCPYGAHIRRMNPRSGAVAGIQHNRRIIRRGVPYGPWFDPQHPDDGVERGLLGAFICGELANQFEFLQQTWANQDISAPTQRGSRDPIIGWQPEVGGRFEIPTGDARGTVVATDLPRLVTTRGSLYLFMPGIGGLRTLVAGPW